MFPERESKLRLPALRKHGSSRRLGLLAVFLHPLIHFGRCEIKCDEPLIPGMDYPPEELISIVQIPAHQ